jgi:hypothetical protein
MHDAYRQYITDEAFYLADCGIRSHGGLLAPPVTQLLGHERKHQSQSKLLWQIEQHRPILSALHPPSVLGEQLHHILYFGITLQAGRQAGRHSH